MSMFDLLKNKRQNMTTQIVKYLICKTVSWTRQTEGKRHDKNKNSCPSPNHNTTFCPT